MLDGKVCTSRRFVLLYTQKKSEEELNQWLIRFYVKHEQEQKTAGAWMIYQLEENDKWILYTAGTSYFESTGGRACEAEEVLKSGLEQLTARVEPHRVMLRVETMEATARQQQKNKMQNQPETTFRRLVNSFYGVQWGKPPLQALRDCKQLAATKTNVKQKFQTATEDPLPAHNAWEDIHQTEPRAREVQPTWKTESIIITLLQKQQWKMPWNANNNPAGDIRAPAMAAVLRLKQQQQGTNTLVWMQSLRVEELDKLEVGSEQLTALRHCALLHPDDFPVDAAGSGGAALMHPRLHAQFVVAVHPHEAVPPGSIALTHPQMINLELCRFQTEKWTLFTERVPTVNAVAIEIRPMLVEDEESDEEAVETATTQPPAAPIVTDAKEFAAAFAKYMWQRVLTEHERLVMPFKDGRDYFIRVLEIDAQDEDETEFTMPDSYRGRVDEDVQVFVSSEGAQSLAFELLNVTPINSAGLASMRSDVVTVLTNDEEEFPVKKKLLFPCIKLSSAVLSGKGVHKDASSTIEVDVDCCTFDRVLLYLEHEARNDGTEFQFDPSVTDDLLAAAITVGCIGLQEVCQRRFGEFETRVRKEAIRWEEVVRRNQSGEVWLVMQGMVLDITRWIPEHPGGSELIAQEAMNVDSTVMFEIYHASRQSFRYLKQFYIGELSEFDLAAMPKPKEQPSEAFIHELQQYTTWRIKPQEHTFKSF